MYDLAAVEALIAKHEAMRSFVYPDEEGHPTVAKGFNLDRPDARARLSSVGANYDLVRAGKEGVSVEQANKLLAMDLADVVADLRALFPSFDAMPDPAQVCLIDIRYNEGPAGFRTHNNTIRDLQRGDYASAAGRFSVSQWARTVGPARTKEDLDMLRQAASLAATTASSPLADHDDGSQGPECA